MRELILADLIKDVLGPRNGVDEILNHSPSGEFITGVLAPQNIHEERDPDTENAAFIEIDTGEPEDMDTGENTAVFSPELNPKDIPHSMGISFCLSARNNNPEIQICVTWARYFQVEENQWKREARAFVSGPVEVFVPSEKENRSRRKLKIDKDGEIVPDDTSAEVCLYIDSKKTAENLFYVSIYLVNVIQNELGKNSDEKRYSSHRYASYVLKTQK
ncbi:hypothetical protein OTK01_000354 [Caldicellulosiruptor acetigenus]|uniref:hypothetical protein n=1 Tax=Caldicellulosiruptor acetigenus TaxID=301953 RepID=UPI0022A950D5|nr:hypothetical protein [Caldicellulosiruptor acetigenus]WAM36580.1 hypothetical protein OTK01_000354 [Caldicellulosiruptor acetigenus]